MANFNKQISDTNIRVGEVRFSYCYLFTPRKNEDGTPGKYSMQILIPKTDKTALSLIEKAIEAAKQTGIQSKWNGKLPSSAKLKTPLRDGDDENPGDDTYAGMMFLNVSTASKPGLRVLDNGLISEALDDEDLYSGCYGAVTINFFPYNTNGNMGVAAGLNNVIKTRDGDKLAGGHSAESDFSDLVSGKSWDD